MKYKTRLAIQKELSQFFLLSPLNSFLKHAGLPAWSIQERALRCKTEL